MTKKALKFDNIGANKKEFWKSKQPVNLDLINVDQIVVSDKFRHNDDGFKYFISYKEGEIVKPLCIILPQTTKTWLLSKMMMCWINTMKFGTTSKLL